MGRYQGTASRGLGNCQGVLRTRRFGDGLSTRPRTLVVRLYATEAKMIRSTVKLIHEGRYAAEIPVQLIEDETGWSPYLSVEDAKKLDSVRLALRRGDVAEAAKH